MNILYRQTISGSSYYPVSITDLQEWVKQIPGYEENTMRTIVSGSLDTFKTDTGYSPCSSIEESCITGSFTAGTEHKFAYGYVPSIISVVDSDGNTLATSSYAIQPKHFANFIRFNTNVDSTRLIIRYNNGWSEGNLPADLKMGLLSLCATRYNYREEFIMSSRSNVDAGYAAMIIKYSPLSLA